MDEDECVGGGNGKWREGNVVKMAGKPVFTLPPQTATWSVAGALPKRDLVLSVVRPQLSAISNIKDKDPAPTAGRPRRLY